MALEDLPLVLFLISGTALLATLLIGAKRWTGRKARQLAQALREEGTPAGRGFSFPLGVPLVVYPLLFGLRATVEGGARWAVDAGTALALLGFTWVAFGRKSYDTIHAKDPTLTRLTWVLNWLLWFVLLPLAAWVALLWSMKGGAP